MENLDSRMLQSERTLAENRVRLARLQGRVEVAFDELAEHTPYVEALRARAWLRHDQPLTITQRGDELDQLDHLVRMRDDLKAEMCAAGQEV